MQCLRRLLIVYADDVLCSPSVLKISTAHEDVGEQTLQTYITALEQGSADVPVLKSLAHLCAQNPVHEPLSPVSPAFSVPPSPSLSPSRAEFWTQDRLFDRLFNALVQFLDFRKVGACDSGPWAEWLIAHVLMHIIECRGTRVRPDYPMGNTREPVGSA